MITYDPRYAQWDQWTALLIEEHSEHGLMIGTPEEDWVEWGIRFVELAQHAGGQSIPDPREFATWVEWGQALMLNDLEPFND